MENGWQRLNPVGSHLTSLLLNEVNMYGIKVLGSSISQKLHAQMLHLYMYNLVCYASQLTNTPLRRLLLPWVPMGMKKRCCQLPLFILLCALVLLQALKLGFCYENSKAAAGCIEAEKKALLKFKGGLLDPSGRLSSWVGEDCCAWKGVICDNRTRNVVKLKLQNPFSSNIDTDGTDYELGGAISPSLLDLKYLRYLDLSKNNFEGKRVPNFFGSLTKLRYLNLSGASFGGAISSSLRNLSSLLYLDLSNNFTPYLEAKDFNWVSSLSSLRYLNLGGADLSEASSHWLQSVNLLPSLVELHLPQCQLLNLPPSLPSMNFTSLLVLELSNNGFNSPAIPYWLFNLSALENLDLSQNSLGGQLLTSLGKLCNLQILKLYSKSFSGEVTEFINALSECTNSRLETLDLGYNTLSGSLPNSLGSLKNLRDLQLWQNMFKGSIPNSIGNLSSLESLYLSYNQMSGSIPDNLGQLSSIVVLELSENPWQGVITETHLANLSSLKELTMTKASPNISVIFKIDPHWLPPFKLRYINIRSCQLGPKFPTWLQNQNELKTVVLNNARISGPLPDWLLKLDVLVDELDVAYNSLSGQVPNSLRFSYLSTVDLSSNSFEGPLPLWSPNVSALYLRDNLFSGPIPPDIGEAMPLLTDLDISRNYLNGNIPLSIGNQTDMTNLAISNNRLSGTIPNIWNRMAFLYFIDMSNNSLSGKIPNLIGSQGCYLVFLFLGKNNLSGEVPSSLQKCTNMDTLDIGDNKLSGNLPSWIGETMLSLLILRVRNNSFTGNIPSQICHLSDLHILDLSNNKFTGIIPTCLGNLSGFKAALNSTRYEGKLQVATKGSLLIFGESNLYLVNSIDLSKNNLSGGIPQALTTLSRLGTLILSGNQLTGKIPEKIGDLGALETLDLSQNKLVGRIPTNMASLTFLSHLNLSYNNLSGEIPASNQFQTLIDPSIYEGNPALCGTPLAKCGDNGNKPSNGGKEEEDEDEDADGWMEKLWFWLTVALGFFIGFWGVCGTLVMKKRYRDAYFSFLNKIKMEIRLSIRSTTQRLKRKLGI